jgi:hypothetical protein
VDGGSILILLLIVLSVVDTATRIATRWGAPIGKCRG